MSIARPSTLLVLLLTSPMGTVQAQPAVSVTGSEAHLAAISSNLARIAELLEAQVESGRFDLVMRRIDLRQRRLGPLEDRLRLARASRDGYEDERFRLQSQLEDAADRFASGTLDMGSEGLANMTKHLELEIALTESGLRTANDEIAALENEVTRYRNEIEDWEAWLDRELSDL